MPHLLEPEAVHLLVEGHHQHRLHPHPPGGADEVHEEVAVREGGAGEEHHLVGVRHLAGLMVQRTAGRWAANPYGSYQPIGDEERVMSVQN